MEFKTHKDVEEFINGNKFLGDGSQGKCYVDKRRELVYKFYFNYFDPIEDDDPIDKEEILRFSHINSDLVMFSKDIILFQGEIIGDISKYAKGTNLIETNPFAVNLNWLIKLCEIALKDLELITEANVEIYDTVYNTLLGDRLYLIDAKDYTWSKRSYNETLAINTARFNEGIMYFLVSGLFEEVIRRNKVLKEMYRTKGNNISIIDFIIELKQYLSELLGTEIEELESAKSLLNKKRVRSNYKRTIEL